MRLWPSHIVRACVLLMSGTTFGAAAQTIPQRTDISIKCSEQADFLRLHGQERKDFRERCKRQLGPTNDINTGDANRNSAPQLQQVQFTGSDFSQTRFAFEQLSVSDRMTVQMLLTATGYWPAVPNLDFGRRLFEAISKYRSDAGLSQQSSLDGQFFGLLNRDAQPLLRLWGFRQVSHPQIGYALWIPAGLDLQVERNENGLVWNDRLRRISLNYEFYANVDVAYAFKVLVDKKNLTGSKIYYKTLKDDFFAISSSLDGVDSYTRYQRVPNGVIGFSLFWKNKEADLHMERVASIMSGSLASSTTGAPFANLPVFREPQQVVAVSRPPEPLPQVVTPKPEPKPEPKQSGASSGTGFFVNSDGIVLTNAHVVNDCKNIQLTADGKSSSETQILAKDAVNDLAVLKTTLKPQRVASFRNGIRLGEQVEAFGYPLTQVLSSSGNFTIGNVTALSGIGDDSRYLQISAPVQPGNSGGPLLDQYGNLVGVVSAKLNALKVMIATNGDVPQNVNFVIKANAATNFLESNRIAITQGNLTAQVSAPDLADQAREMSAFIVCGRE